MADRRPSAREKEGWGAQSCIWGTSASPADHRSCSLPTYRCPAIEHAALSRHRRAIAGHGKRGGGGRESSPGRRANGPGRSGDRHGRPTRCSEGSSGSKAVVHIAEAPISRRRPSQIGPNRIERAAPRHRGAHAIEPHRGTHCIERDRNAWGADDGGHIVFSRLWR